MAFPSVPCEAGNLGQCPNQARGQVATSQVTLGDRWLSNFRSPFWGESCHHPREKCSPNGGHTSPLTPDEMTSLMTA
jgi:hypothetical protein